MGTHEQAVIYRSVIAAVNRGNMDDLDSLLDENLVDHNPIYTGRSKTGFVTGTGLLAV